MKSRVDVLDEMAFLVDRIMTEIGHPFFHRIIQSGISSYAGIYHLGLQLEAHNFFIVYGV